MYLKRISTKTKELFSTLSLPIEVLNSEGVFVNKILGFKEEDKVFMILEQKDDFSLILLVGNEVFVDEIAQSELLETQKFLEDENLYLKAHLEDLERLLFIQDMNLNEEELALFKEILPNFKLDEDSIEKFKKFIQKIREKNEKLKTFETISSLI